MSVRLQGGTLWMSHASRGCEGSLRGPAGLRPEIMKVLLTHKPIAFRICYWRYAVCLVTLLSLLDLTVHAQPAHRALPASLEEVFTRGVTAQKAGQLETAEKAFLQVLQQGGKVAYVYNNLGIVYQQRGEHQRAVSQFREAIRLQPDYVAPRILLGASWLVLGKVQEATRELERAVKLQPREPLARQQLAKSYELAGNIPGVVDQFRRIRELAPQEPEYAYQLGKAYMKLSEWSYQQIMRIKPGSARLHQTLGQQLDVQGKPDLALQAYQRAAETDPTLPEIHLAMAQICLQQGKKAEARKQIEHELAIVPESAAALTLKRKIEESEVKP